MEYVKCHNCGSDQSSYYATENGYNLVRCAECGLIYLNPRPDAEEIQDAHKLGVHRGEHDFDITGHFDKGKIRNYLKILRDFYTPEQLAGSSWLDVGCGHGEFLVALREFTNGNIQLRGLEPNVQKQISAQKQGLDVSQFDLATHEQRYDRISLLNVYGHLPDPVGMLSTLRTLLLPSGELLLETGDSADLSCEEHYRPFYLPDHLHFASERIIISLLTKAGYEIINIQKYAFVPANIGTAIKEFIKVFLPNKHSRLKYLVMYQKYAHADMYVHARVSK